MTTSKLLEKRKMGKVGKEPVVMVPLETWREIEDRLEDAEMYQYKGFRASIAKARKEVKERKLYQFDVRTGEFKKAKKSK